MLSVVTRTMTVPVIVCARASRGAAQIGRSDRADGLAIVRAPPMAGAL
jgi:hypothetical protein